MSYINGRFLKANLSWIWSCTWVMP